jgi:hypothetical protein
MGQPTKLGKIELRPKEPTNINLRDGHLHLHRIYEGQEQGQSFPSNGKPTIVLQAVPVEPRLLRRESNGTLETLILFLLFY